MSSTYWGDSNSTREAPQTTNRVMDFLLNIPPTATPYKRMRKIIIVPVKKVIP